MTRVQVLGEPIDGGFRVCETERYYVDVLTMMFGNLRIVTTPKASPLTYERGWCYHDPIGTVVLTALSFDPDAGEEPAGWVKETGTNRRPCASYLTGPRQHEKYVAECPDCGRDER